MSLRLLLDQNLRVETSDFLRQLELELDVVSTRELRMSRASDRDIAEVAVAEDRVIVTFNHDFGDLRDFPIGGTPGVIRLRIEPQTLETVHPVLETVFRRIDHKKFKRALTTVTKDKVRIRGTSALTLEF